MCCQVLEVGLIQGRYGSYVEAWGGNYCLLGVTGDTTCNTIARKNQRLLRRVSFGWTKQNNKTVIETTKKFFTFDVSTSIRGLHQKKLVLGLLLPVIGSTLTYRANNRKKKTFWWRPLIEVETSKDFLVVSMKFLLVRTKDVFTNAAQSSVSGCDDAVASHVVSDKSSSSDMVCFERAVQPKCGV